MNQLTRTFFELFRMFSGLDMRQFITHIPFYGKQHEHLRNLVSRKESMTNFLDKITKQCPHCGKIFNVNKTSIENSIILDHIKFCRLERSNCECGLTYRTGKSTVCLPFCLQFFVYITFFQHEKKGGICSCFIQALNILNAHSVIT